MILLACAAHAQTYVGGIINASTAVRSIRTEGCASFVQVADTAGFAVGDDVLVIQIMGCTDSARYAVGSVGLFERATIHGMDARGILELERPLLRAYEECGRIQVVRIPVFTGTVIVNDTLRARAWDGSSGGVICMDVRGTLVLNAAIDASGIGFPGGAVWNGSGQCSTITPDTPINHPDAAMKGGTYVVAASWQRGGGAALFSGGGGGLGHNSGGGGGGNAGDGGTGGAQWQGCGARFGNGGRGGKADSTVDSSLVRLRFGGGGGAGHMNNQRGTSGGVGGGIVILLADSIVGNGFMVNANGASALMAGNDGAGGGGAGGSVFVSARAWTGTLTCSAAGGTGGSVSVGDLHGPGGGGGGGVVMTSDSTLPAAMACTVQGGSMGRCIAINDTNASWHLAKAGAPGRTVFSVRVPENTASTRPSSVTIMSDTSVCAGQSCLLTLRILRSGDTLQSAPSIEWRGPDGKVIATTPTLALTPSRTSRYIVTIRDSAGCTARDTATVGVMNTTDVSVLSTTIDTVFCQRVVDTSLVIRNTGTATVTVTSVEFDRRGSDVIDALPVTVAGGDSVRVRVRVTTGSTLGPDSAVATVRFVPCDTVVTAALGWTRGTRVLSMTPSTVRMNEVFSCAAIDVDTTVTFTMGSKGGVITAVVCRGTVAYRGPLPVTIGNDSTVAVPLRWSPQPSATRGTAGLVRRSDGCDDTVWVEVDGVARMPRMSAPDTLRAGDILICANTPAIVDIPLRSSDFSVWRIAAISAPREVIVDRIVGDSITGNGTVRARVAPGAVGPFTYVVELTLLPCDTTIRVWLSGKGITSVLSHADTTDIIEPIIGRSKLSPLVVRNTGTEPVTVTGVANTLHEPFASIAFVPALPCTLSPGDSLVCFVRLLQRYGRHADSLILTTSNPCAPRERQFVVTQAGALTRVRMPDLFLPIGTVGMIPILMDGRPSIEPTLLDTFTVDIAVRSEHLSVTDGSDAHAVWTCTGRDSRTHIRVTGRWQGGDTLAVIPARVLMSTSASTPLTFTRTPGFVWSSQTCDMEYADGSVTFGDVCGDRSLRMVSLTSAIPFSMAPNPASEILTIVPDDVVDGAYHVSVVNSIGVEMLRHQGKGPLELMVRDLTPGFYLVRITSETGTYGLPLLRL